VVFGIDGGDEGKDNIASWYQSSSVTRVSGIPEEVNQAFNPERSARQRRSHFRKLSVSKWNMTLT